MEQTQQENVTQFNNDWKKALVYLSKKDQVSIPLSQYWDCSGTVILAT